MQQQSCLHYHLSRKKRKRRLPSLPATQSEVEFGGEWAKTMSGTEFLPLEGDNNDSGDNSLNEYINSLSGWVLSSAALLHFCNIVLLYYLLR